MIIPKWYVKARENLPFVDGSKCPKVARGERIPC